MIIVKELFNINNIIFIAISELHHKASATNRYIDVSIPYNTSKEPPPNSSLQMFTHATHKLQNKISLC